MRWLQQARRADRTATGPLARLLSGHCSPGRWAGWAASRTRSTDHIKGTAPVPFRVRPDPRRPGKDYRSLRTSFGRRTPLSSPMMGEDSGEGDPDSDRKRSLIEGLCRLSSFPPHPNLLPPGEKGLVRRVPRTAPTAMSICAWLVSHPPLGLFVGDTPSVNSGPAPTPPPSRRVGIGTPVRRRRITNYRPLRLPRSPSDRALDVSQPWVDGLFPRPPAFNGIRGVPRAPGV